MMYSHGNLLWTARKCAEAMRLDDGDISFSFLPISHITEQLLSIYCHVLVGHRGTPWLAL
jgi:long-subunit acyl-CoA synthetase (AMP-forming)